MYPIFIEKLDLIIQSINIIAQKIDGTTFKIYKMIVAVFLIINQVNRVKFFEETFLIANISLDIVCEMLFLTLSSANVDFSKKKLRWRFYTIKKAYPITKQVE